MSQNKQPKTTLKYKGEEYPYYRTNRGSFEFENLGYTVKDIAEGKQSAMMANIYCQLKDCAKRAGTPISDTLGQFIDSSDTEIFSVYTRLQKESEKIKAEEAGEKK